MRSLVLAVNLLGVERVCVVQHTDCAMTQASGKEVASTIGRLRGVDASGWDFLVIDDRDRILAADTDEIRRCPLLPSDLAVALPVAGMTLTTLPSRTSPGQRWVLSR